MAFFHLKPHVVDKNYKSFPIPRFALLDFYRSCTSIVSRTRFCRWDSFFQPCHCSC